MDLDALRIDRSASRRAPTPNSPKGARPGGRRRASPWFARLVVLAAMGGLLWLFRAPLLRTVDRWTLTEVEAIEAARPRRGAAGAVKGTAANGYVVAARRAALSADTPGRVVELNVTEGSLVQRGDVVARLYADEFAAALLRAQAEGAVAEAEVKAAEARQFSAEVDLERRRRELLSAKALLTQAIAERTLAEEDFERATSLADQGISAASLLDRARAERDRAAASVDSSRALADAAASGVSQAEAEIERSKADVATAVARVAAAKAAITQAQATLDKTIVRAPFDGIVVLKDAEVGEVVSPNSQGGSNARGSICTMVDRDSLEVQVDLPESSLEDITIGAPATVYLDAYPDAPYRGRVDRIWPTANRQKATVEIRVTLERRDERLRPDMGLRVVFQPAADPTVDGEGTGDGTGDRDIALEDLVIIPASAVVDAAGERSVFLLEQDVVRIQPVTVAESRGATVAITAGLREGQRLVAAPPPSLRSGDRVQIKNP